MKQHDEVLEIIRREKLIAILRGVPIESVPGVVEALILGGIMVLEFTFDHTCQEDMENNAEKIRYTVKRFGDRVAVGSGTALNLEEVDATMRAGGSFVVTPAVDTELIAYAKKQGLVVIPGALTPTEVLMAWKAGADIVKLFPGGEMGISYVKSLQGPLGFIPMCAVGGVQPENVKNYLDAGICGFGVGSSLVLKDAVQNRDYNAIRCRAAQFVQAILS